MRTRRAGLAGSWYDGTAEGLAAEVDECLRQAERRYGRVAAGAEPVAIVVPHAGLAFSGAVAAAAYRMVRDAYDRVDTFVVFGAAHRERLTRPAIWLDGPWKTPLGDIAIDHELGQVLVADGIGIPGASAHAGDNAIELQTPFIKRLFPEARLLPVAMGVFSDAWRLGEQAAAAAAATA
ncbi:MAG: AmmeMemoRadiSam system protein B, partial [Planctomycetes bacterium]|nr:AmmeMemoRadiSam system protein B [Planctomycetota bacterium]